MNEIINAKIAELRNEAPKDEHEQLIRVQNEIKGFASLIQADPNKKDGPEIKMLKAQLNLCEMQGRANVRNLQINILNWVKTIVK